jgi:hypothetical protein
LFDRNLYDHWRDLVETNDFKEVYTAIISRLESIAADAREDHGDDLTGAPALSEETPEGKRIKNILLQIYSIQKLLPGDSRM